MTDPFGYTDPAEQVHEDQALRDLAQPLPYVQQPLQPVQSPLAGLPQAEAQIFSSAGVPRYENTAERMLVGAILGGLLGMIFAKKREARRQRKAQRLQELQESLGVKED